jgi:phage virion morphogenesis protein
MITIEANTPTVLQALRELEQRMTDMTPVMREIGQRLESRVRARFETETDPLGNAWAPWAASYDPAQGGSRPTNGNTTLLDLYGDMLGGLSHSPDATGVTIGFNQDYAVYHEYGTRTMPRRGMLFANPSTGELAPDDEADILDVIQSYLAQPL